MGLRGGGGFAILPTDSCISKQGTMKIGGVYILSRRSITRMIKAIATAFAALCIYTSSFGDMLLASRYANTSLSLLSLKSSLKSDAARTVVPDLLYLEGKALYFKAKSSVAARPEIAPYQAAATSAAPPVAAVAGRPPYRNGRDVRCPSTPYHNGRDASPRQTAVTKADLRAAVKTILRGEDVNASKPGPRLTPAKQRQIEAAEKYRTMHCGCTLHNACMKSFTAELGGYSSSKSLYLAMRQTNC